MNALERKEHFDEEKKKELEVLAKANSQMPKGTISEYAMEVKAKVQKYEEEKNVYGGLTKEELEEA